MKKLALLGSTGSIGTQALDVVRCIQKEGEHAVKWRASLPIPIFGFWKSRSGNLNRKQLRF